MDFFTNINLDNNTPLFNFFGIPIYVDSILIICIILMLLDETDCDFTLIGVLILLIL